MSALRRRLAAALAAGAALFAVLPLSGSVAAPTRERWDTKVLAKVQSPGYPAFVYAHPNGRVYAGTYSNPTGDSIPSRVFEWTRDGTLRHPSFQGLRSDKSARQVVRKIPASLR